MTEPMRLRDRSADPLTPLLLAAGRSDLPSKARLDRIVGGIAAAGITLGAESAAASAGVLASAPAAAKTAAPLSLVLKWLSIGAIGGMAVGAVGAKIQMESSTESPATVVAPVRHEEAAASVDSRPAALASPAAPERVDDLDEARPPGARAPRARAPSVAITTEAEPAEAEPLPASSDATTLEARRLREEVEALAIAKAALNRGAPAAAVEAVRAYRSKYHPGRLEPEAAFIEMEAEHARGNRARAAEIARRLAVGTSPSADRAREILEGSTR